MRWSFFAQIREMRLAQIELALNPATRLVLQLAVAVRSLIVLPLGCDQQQLDLVLVFR